MNNTEKNDYGTLAFPGGPDRVPLAMTLKVLQPPTEISALTNHQTKEALKGKE